MRIEATYARQKNRRNWAEYECARAQFGPISLQKYVMAGHRAFSLRVFRIEVVLSDLWIVRDR